jgi:hypothetical protein
MYDSLLSLFEQQVMAGGKKGFYGIRPNRSAPAYDDFEPGVFTDFYKASSITAGKKNSLLYAFASENEAWNFALELGTEKQAGDGRLSMPTSVQSQLDARKQGRSFSEREEAEQSARMEQAKSAAELTGGVSAVASSQPSIQLSQGLDADMFGSKGTSGVHIEKQRKLQAPNDVEEGNQAGILGAAPVLQDPIFVAVHQLASQISSLSGVVQSFDGRLFALEHVPTQVSLSAPSTSALTASPSQASSTVPSTSNTPAGSSLLNPAAPSFWRPVPASPLPVATKPLNPAQEPVLQLPTPPPPRNQLKLEAHASFLLREPGLEFIISELSRREIPLPKDTSVNWASKTAPWRTLIIGFPGAGPAEEYLQRANAALNRMGPATDFTLGYWDPTLQRQAQQQSARGAEISAEGAEQAHKPIVAAQELLSGWLQAGQSADPEALRQLADMLSECYESCLSALTVQENVCNARSAYQSLASRSTASIPPSATASSIHGLRFETLNVRGKLGSNVHEVLNLLCDVKLDVLCIQESLHAIVDVPDYMWVTLSTPLV